MTVFEHFRSFSEVLAMAALHSITNNVFSIGINVDFNAAFNPLLC